MSIAHILDVAFDENVSLEEALVRNKRDAQTRPVIWDAELLAQSVTDEDLAVVTAVPVGVKDVSGRFLPMQTILEAEDEGIEKVRKRIGVVPNPEAVFVPQGRLEETLVDSHMSDNEALRRAVRDAYCGAPWSVLTRYADVRSLPPRSARPRPVYRLLRWSRSYRASAPTSPRPKTLSASATL